MTTKFSWFQFHTFFILLALIFMGSCKAPTPPAPPAPAPRQIQTPLSQISPITKTQPVLIIKPTDSVVIAAERSYAEKVSDRLRGWIQSVGIPVNQVTDGQFAAGAFQDARVAILPYNSTLSSKELLACRRFVEGGGKLIVLFSADPGLAKLMGVRLGSLTRAPGADSWSAFRFVENALPAIPARIEQTSLSLIPAYPAGQNARVIAWWENTSGQLPPEPAWLQSDRGFWMSHILLESDVPAKKRLLVNLLGTCDRDLWRVAATHAINQAGQLGKYQNSAQAIESIRTLARENNTSETALPLLDRAAQLQQKLSKEYQGGHYAQTIQSASQLDTTLTEAYASIQPSKEGEFRGVWNHSGTGFTPGSWDQTCQILARAGMTAVLPHVQRPWCAHYPSRMTAPSDILTRYGDQVAACCTAAKHYGLETHAWVILWNLEGAPDETIAPYRNAGRLQVSSTGTTISWLCPSHPSNRTFELSLIRELASRYPLLNGIHLDYTRFKSQDFCYCNGCRTRFAQATGISVRHWPAEVLTGPRQAAYRQWRRDLLTRFVSDVHQKVHQINPELKLSASVYPLYPGVRDSIAQDWGEWLRLGLLDFVCPMSYTASPEKFIEWYRRQVAYPGVKGKVYAGIGVTSMECRLTAVETITQINALRKDGATGFTLFEANPTLKNDILPYLQMGTTK
ncbi:MAG: family 10 glycosylhydrolase [bacterium]